MFLQGGVVFFSDGFAVTFYSDVRYKRGPPAPEATARWLIAHSTESDEWFTFDYLGHWTAHIVRKQHETATP